MKTSIKEMKQKKYIVILILLIQSLVNHAQLSFSKSEQQLTNKTSFGLDVGDLDNDGDLDIYVSPIEGPDEVWINNGKGNFEKLEQDFPDNSGLTCLELVDIDNDNDLDVVRGNSGADHLFINEGNGIFHLSDQVFSSYKNTYGLASGDINNDGFNDLVFANALFENQLDPTEIWTNNTNSVFTHTQTIEGDNNFVRVDALLEDLDADNDLDLVLVTHLEYVNGSLSRTPPNEIWFNDGLGNFTDSGQKLGNSADGIVSSGDIDNDGDLDLVITCHENDNTCWINDGNGLFTKSSANIGSYKNDIKLVDFDNDGYLDVLTVGSNGIKIYLNTENGNFQDSGISFPSNNYRRIQTGDFDLDGDMDFVVTGTNLTHVWVNDLIITGSSEQLKQNYLRIYPNPAKNTLKLKYHGIIEKTMNYKIHDLNGKTLLEGVLCDNTINISSLSKGTYIVILVNQDLNFNKIISIE